MRVIESTQTDGATANSFLDALSAAADDPQSNLRLVITLRADFYDRPLRHRAMGELLRRGTELVTPMSPEQVERAITGPAEREGVHFEAGLVAAIVADVAEHPGSLPLLQYALTELFERRRGAVIELTSYREIGGLTGALARRAESLYAALDPGAKGAVRQALLRLVTLGDGADADVRRRVLRRDLTGLDPSVDHALETFGKHRLLTFDRDPATRGPTVEIAHEALLTEWDRLRGWIDASRDDIRRERRLGAAAAEWHAAGRPVDYLLSGSRLDELSGWAASTDLTLDPCEQKYLAASEARRDDERAAEHERVRRETQLAHSRRTRTLLLVASAVVLALVAGLATYAFVQRNEADRLAGQIASQSEARRLASAAVVLAAEQPDLAIRVALESLDSSARAGAPALLEAEEALHWALQSARVPYPDADWPVEVRAGPAGPTGIYRMPLDELVEMALGHVGPRALTALECSRVHLTPCPTRTAASWPVIPTETHRPPLPDQTASLIPMASR